MLRAADASWDRDQRANEADYLQPRLDDIDPWDDVEDLGYDPADGPDEEPGDRLIREVGNPTDG